MTGTTQISINTKLYNQAADYARQHNTSVEKMMESLFVTFLCETKQQKTMKRPTHYSPELLKLVGIAQNANISPDDLNADKARWEYLKEKYDLYT